MKIKRFANATRIQLTRRTSVSITHRDRAKRFQHELYRGERASFLKVGVSSPTHHRWWATTIYVNRVKPDPNRVKEAEVVEDPRPGFLARLMQGSETRA